MEADMRLDEVKSRLQQLKMKGDSLSKKKVKEKDPRLMRNALFYFPSWEHAVQSIDA